MSINLFKLKKWANMILGRSSYHVNQSEGKLYSINDVKGYYNNLTEKITRFAMPGDEIPITADDDGTKRHFCIAIFQYGLAAYDLWLEFGEDHYLRKFQNCVEWAVSNQRKNGSWEAFYRQNPSHPFSAMAQGEGISLLTRAYIRTKDERYLECAEKAFNFLLTDKTDGGVAEHNGNDLFLYEFTYLPLVLNGWIFASWGLLDYYKITGDEKAENAWKSTIKTMAKKMPEFDTGYWSYYNLGHALTSPFYHRLHIAQVKVMFKLTGEKAFETYAIRWQNQLNNPFKKLIAFIAKTIQKIIE